MSEPPVPVPTHCREVDSSWLSQALGTRVIRARRATLGGEVPMTADVMRFELEGAGPRSVVVKLGTRPACAGMYEREVRTYRELAGVLPMPRCFHAAMRDGRGVLVLADLTEIPPGAPLRGLTLQQATALLEAALAWHALEPAGWTVKVLPDGAAFQHRIERGWRVIDRDRFPASPEVAALIERVIPSVPDELDALDQSPRGLVHSDLHAGNLWFNGAAPVVFDWQNTATGPVARDLASILTSTRPELIPDLWTVLTDHADPAALRAALVYACGAIAWFADHATTTERDSSIMLGHWSRLTTALQVAFD